MDRRCISSLHKRVPAAGQGKLSEDGVFLQWINSQFVDEKLLKILTATIVNEFNYVELYQPERQVLMFVASQDPIDIWQGNMGARKALNDHKQHYARMGAKTLEDIVAMTFWTVKVLNHLRQGSLSTLTTGIIWPFSQGPKQTD